MRHKLLSGLLALTCVGLLAVPAFAAEPILSDSSSAPALCKIYSYKVGVTDRLGKSGLTRDIRGDEVACTVSERVCDDRGNIYRITDSTPLSDSELFSRKTTVGLGAPHVSSIAPADYDVDGFTGSSFRIKLAKNYSGQSSAVEFENTYTAKQDTSLAVYSVSDKQHQQLQVKKGATLTSECKILLNERTIDVTKYLDPLPS